MMPGYLVKEVVSASRAFISTCPGPADSQRWHSSSFRSTPSDGAGVGNGIIAMCMANSLTVNMIALLPVDTLLA